jgi:hypothetical protein
LLADTLRVLPYALGIAATPQLVQVIRAASRGIESRRHILGLATGWSAALIFLAGVALLIDLDGSTSGRLGGIFIIGVGLLTILAACCFGDPVGVIPIEPALPASTPHAWWIGRGIGGVVLDIKNVALVLAAGVSIDNTGGVARAELRLVATLVLFVSIGLIAAAELGVRHLPSDAGATGRTRSSSVTNSRVLVVSGLGVVIDGILILP